MNRARPMAARLKKPRVNLEPRSAHGRAVNKPRVNLEPRSAHGRAVNKSWCRPIRSVIILVINKSDSCCAVVRFCHHSYDNRSNWTPLSPITITNLKPCVSKAIFSSCHLGPPAIRLTFDGSGWFGSRVWVYQQALGIGIFPRDVYMHISM